MATTTPNFGWPVPTSTDLVKDGATAIEGLGDAIDASLLDLKGGTTGQVLAKASGTDMDFSWVAQDDSNAIQNAIVDAKGDLIAASANDTPARLAVGANNTVLIADSAEATGLKWGGGWTTWTPTYVNFTLGNGTVTARYQQVGKTVNFRVTVTLGSTSSVTGAIGLSLPVSNGLDERYVNAIINDTGTGNYAAWGFVYDSNVYLRILPSNGTYLGVEAVSATVPMTWANTDKFTITGSYEAA
jgi:hypothetical protein